ncbi:hypothetical protein AAC387_Pa12g0878 [Persea americana]
MKLPFALVFFSFSLVLGATDPQDLQVLNDFRECLENPELLKWPSDGNDPCGPPSWPHIFCSGTRVSQIQVHNLGLNGCLPQNFNQLSSLTNIGFQRNNLSGHLPSFSGLSALQYAFLDFNQFDTIPLDFFDGLASLRVLSLDYNPLNKTTGWSLPIALQNSVQLMNLSLIGCNLIGPMPDFLGAMPSLTALKLSYNRLSGEIPSSYGGSELQILWLNNQNGSKLSGPINIIASMSMLRQLWLHGNQFTGTIPVGLAGCISLTDLWLSDNELVGTVPDALVELPLQMLRLDNNKLTGSIPKFEADKFSYSGNSFCQSVPGIPCSSEVTTLLDFLAEVNYPVDLASSWSGNDPCAGWFGISCNNGKVSVINLPNMKLNGTLSSSIGKLDSLVSIILGGNNLFGSIPENLVGLKTLRVLNLSGNELAPPVPIFGSSVRVYINGNPLLEARLPMRTPRGNSPPPWNTIHPPPVNSPDPDLSTLNKSSEKKVFKRSKVILIAVLPVAFSVSLVLLMVFICTKKGVSFQALSLFDVRHNDQSNPKDTVKFSIGNDTNVNSSKLVASSSQSSSLDKRPIMDFGNRIISVHVLRKLTHNFSSENEIGRGGFGTVYKGIFDDGTVVAIKRMEASVINNQALNEFQAEIEVLSKVRHRHLVSLLAYFIEGSERLLVYEYMPQGALSRHLFQWKSQKLEPLSWMQRLNIALDVARGLEYLHGFAHQSFIHRDLKSSNILLCNDYRAKISDFGLVKNALDGKTSIAATRLAGTFGYLAPEYAVTGKVTTKADVFSFGVVLMELITGLRAIDDSRPEESRYLAEWFWRIRLNEDKLKAAVDSTLYVMEETYNNILIVAELAVQCTMRDPNQRPDMGHVVNVLVPLVEKWKPTFDDQNEYSSIDYRQSLLQMVYGWQTVNGTSDADASNGSIPARPMGFAESFTSAYAR